MLPFSTEFPVAEGVNRQRFINEMIEWLSESPHFEIMNNIERKDFDKENVHLSSPRGEEIRVREINSENGWSVIGFRHDMPDTKGRLWRTECVLKRGRAPDHQHIVRIRTQCYARTPDAIIETPKKPHLIRTLLERGAGGKDGILDVTNNALYLERSARDLEMAVNIFLGDASIFLPIIYISMPDNAGRRIGKHKIGKLAYALGGVAHVVVEPDRRFSFDLRDKSEGRNVYGGTVGIIVPKRGLVRRIRLDWPHNINLSEFTENIKNTAKHIRSHMPVTSWDWAELQEEALRIQREHDRKRLTDDELKQLYQNEIDSLKSTIEEQKNEIKFLKENDRSASETQISIDEYFSEYAGNEVYSGEIIDRLRYAAKISLMKAEQVGLDNRSRHVLSQICDSMPPTPALDELIKDLDRAITGRAAVNDITKILLRHGYVKKSDNGHPRLEPRDDLPGLGSITLSKTPSDHRGLKNLRSQIEASLGLTQLKK